MKRIIIVICLTFASVPCTAQWNDAGFAGYDGSKVLAFGIHDTNLFVGDSGAGRHLLYRWTPPNKWGEADKNIGPGWGSISSFATLGKSLYASAGAVQKTYQSTDEGASWDYATGNSVASNGHFLFGTTTHPFTTQPLYVALSRDTGKKWDSVSIFNNGISAVYFSCMGNCILACSGTTLWRSADTGHNWSQLSPPFTGTVTIMRTLLFMVGNGSLSKSTDSGTSWNVIQVDSAGKSVSVNCLATDGKHLFAGTTKGLMVSQDTGKSWRARNEEFVDVYHNNTMSVTAVCVFDSLVFADVTSYNGADYYYMLYDRPIRELIDSTQSGVRVASVPSFDSLEVFPNPASGLVTIRGSYSIARVSVLNVLGAEVLNVPNNRENELTLDLSHFASGTYFLRIETAKGIVMRKVVRE